MIQTLKKVDITNKKIDFRDQTGCISTRQYVKYTFQMQQRRQQQSLKLFLWCENILHISTNWKHTVKCESTLILKKNKTKQKNLLVQ